MIGHYWWEGLDVTSPFTQDMLDERTRQIVEYLRRSPSMSGAAQRIEEVFIGKPLDPPPDGVEDGA